MGQAKEGLRMKKDLRKGIYAGAMMASICATGVIGGQINQQAEKLQNVQAQEILATEGTTTETATVAVVTTTEVATTAVAETTTEIATTAVAAITTETAATTEITTGETTQTIATTETKTETTTEEQKIKNIAISGPDTIRIITQNNTLVSEKIDLVAKVYPEVGTDKRILTWTSSDIDIAVVDINGRVKGIAPGTVTITATSYDGSVQATHKVTVIYDGPILNEQGKTVYYEDGKMIKNQYYKIDGKTYYLGTDGTKVSGWQVLDGKTYYFMTPGIYVTGWQDIAGKRYYFNTKGVMQTGWQVIKRKNYYFTQNGVMLRKMVFYPSIGKR